MKKNSLDTEIRRMRAESASRRPLADHDPFDPGEVAPGFGVNEAQSRREAENVAASLGRRGPAHRESKDVRRSTGYRSRKVRRRPRAKLNRERLLLAPMRMADEARNAQG